MVKKGQTEEGQRIGDFLPQDEDTADDLALVGQLISADGKIKADLDVPKEFEVEIMAEQMVDHLVLYKQSKQNWRAARNLGERSRAQQLYSQMNMSQLAIAIIQNDYPKAKQFANEIMELRARRARKNRQTELTIEDDS